MSAPARLDSLAWVLEELASLEAAGLVRSPATVEGRMGPEVVVDGRPHLLLGSNNYLDLAGHQAVEAGAQAALAAGGTGTGASRLVSGTTVLHRSLEEAIAHMLGADDAIVFSSGYLANVSSIPVLVGPGDEVFSDALNHASIVDGCRLSGAARTVYPHADMDALQSALRNSAARRRLIVSDSVFSMDGDIAAVEALVALAQEHGAMLMLDESHAFGVLGETGGGVADTPALRDGVTVRMATLSKAAGSTGGFVAGSRPIINLLRNRARGFIFDTSPAPAALGAALAALGVMDAGPWRRARLMALTDRLRGELSAIGLRVPDAGGPIVPLMVGEVAPAMKLAAALRERDVLAPAIRPPSVAAGTCRLRLTLSSGFSDAQFDRAVASIHAAARETGLV